MAIENKVFLNGQIRRLRKVKDEGGNTTYVQMGLLVIRRPNKMAGNRNGNPRKDVVPILVRNKDMIEQIERSGAGEGDVAQVIGTFCTVHGPKAFHCANCGERNEYEGAISYVYPLMIKTGEIHPKATENVTLSPAERMRSSDEMRKLLNDRKNLPGHVIAAKEKRTEDGGSVVRITVREPVTEKDAMKWLLECREGSNDVFLIGHLCGNPTYNPKDNGGRVCTYQLGVNRKVFISEDSPENKSDFPWIKSLGDQADKDRDALQKGSLVFIEGAIQARDGFKVKKTCECCGAENEVDDSAMEVVPYAVEYLRGCNRLPGENWEDDEMFDDDFEFDGEVDETDDDGDPFGEDSDYEDDAEDEYADEPYEEEAGDGDDE